MEAKFQELKNRLSEVSDLNYAGAVLGWDQLTYLPPGGVTARGRQIATLGKIAQDRATHPAIGTLLDELRPYEERLPYNSNEASLIRVARRDYEQLVKVPSAFMAEFLSHSSASYEAWTAARLANNFNAVQPYLEKTLDLSRQLANYFPGYEHIADPLIDFSDSGVKASDLRTIFSELRQELVPLVQKITAQPPADDSCLRRHFPQDDQLDFCEAIAAEIGYDFKRGRMDLTHHPFTTSFSIGDVRITTRVREDFLGEALFSTIHEAGHALYEQGIDPDLEGTPLAQGTSSGVHESQSRLWENVVGRSLEAWTYFYPKLQATFPDSLGDVPLETFHRAINTVERSLIRTDADEVTYNLHIMLRFELELDLLEGNLAVKDLPEAWRQRFERDLGILPPDDKDGVLQDVHWFDGKIGGAFQGYSLGNILSAQFYNAALQAHPEIPQELSRGRTGVLLNWLQENIYRHGRKFTANELVQRITGGQISIQPYIQYLRTKYGSLYDLE
jgi:carboxypeptidase Taq